MINFFAPKICIDIIVNNSCIRVVYKNELLMKGTYDSCMSKIRQIVNNIPIKEEKTFVFNIINKAKVQRQSTKSIGHTLEANYFC